MNEEPATTRLRTSVDNRHDSYIMLIIWENGEITTESTSGMKVGMSSELTCEPTQQPHMLWCYCVTESSEILWWWKDSYSIWSHMQVASLLMMRQMTPCAISHNTWCHHTSGECQNVSKVVRQRTDRSLQRTNIRLSGTRIKWHDNIHYANQPTKGQWPYLSSL